MSDMECRFCLNTTVSKSIFELKYAILQPFLCLLQIKKNDGLPHMLCSRCINKISPMETFYKKCKEIDTYLRSKQTEYAKTNNEKQNPIVTDEVNTSEDEDKPLFEVFLKKEKQLNLLNGNKTITNQCNSFVQETLKQERNPNILKLLKVADRISIGDQFLSTNKLKIQNSSNPIKIENEREILNKSFGGCDIKFNKEALKIECDVDKKEELSEGSDTDIKYDSDKPNYEKQLTGKSKQIFSTDIRIKQKRQPLKLFCPACNMKLLSIPLYVKHVRTHKGVLTCKICGFPFITKQKLRTHMLKIHYCTHCKKYFKDKRPHERMEHDKSFVPIFPEEQLITVEKKAPEVNLCPICGAIVKSSIVKHMEIHSNASFKCNFCTKTFVTKFRLQQHTKIHYNQRNFECDYCGNKFTSRHTLILHIKGVHLKSYTTSCSICGKVFSGRGYLKEHIKRHMGDKRFICNICSDSFVNARSLRDHITKHTTDRPYICAYCPKAFKTKEGCKRHEKIHKGVTPHKCPVCFKGFIQRANMKSHFKYNHKEMDFEKEDENYKLMNHRPNECLFLENNVEKL